jgi:hypothetical protein
MRNEDAMEENQQLLMAIMRLADRVTMARLGLLKEMDEVPGEPTVLRYEVGAPAEWDKYPAYFRQTFGYIAASVRDGYATLDAPAQAVEVE